MLGTPAVLGRLVALAAESGMEGLRRTAASACAHLVRVHPRLGGDLLASASAEKMLARAEDGDTLLMQSVLASVGCALCPANASGAPGSPPPPPALQGCILRVATAAMLRDEPAFRLNGCVVAASLCALDADALLRAVVEGSFLQSFTDASASVAGTTPPP